MKSVHVEHRLRQFLLVVAAFICLGTPVELLLANHTEEPTQFIPFGLCAVGLLAVLAALLRPNRSTILTLRIGMVVVALGSLLGVYYHLMGNFEFEREIRPSAAATDVFLKALNGASPLLAPIILILAAVLAIGATWYHPALGNRSSE